MLDVFEDIHCKTSYFTIVSGDDIEDGIETMRYYIDELLGDSIFHTAAEQYINKMVKRRNEILNKT